MLKDFEIFYRAGQAILAGQSPYNDTNFFYAPPAAYFFGLWALLPFQVAVGLWWAASAATLIGVMRRTAWLWFLFPPVFANFVTGQVDIFLLGLWALVGRGSGVALALMTLKPQLCLLIVPWTLWQWRGERRRLLAFGLSVAALYLPPALLSPAWTIEWLTHRLFGYRDYADEAFPSLVMLTDFGRWAIPLYLVAAALAVWWAWSRHREAVKTVGLLIAPVLRPYNYALVAEPARLWRTVLIGWIAWAIFLIFGETRQYIVLPLAALWERRRSERVERA